MFRPLTALCLSLCLPQSAIAQSVQPTPPAPARPPVAAALPGANPASLAAAKRLLDSMGYEDLMRRMMDSMMGPMEQQMKSNIEARTEQPIDDAVVSKLAQVVRRHFTAKMIDDPRMRQATELIYARHFTAPELDHMAVLYRDPVMKRFLDRMPVVMAEFMPLVTGAMDQDNEAMEAEIKDIIEEYFADKEAPKSGS